MSVETNEHFNIDPESVATARAQLLEMARGMPVAEAAVEGFTEWQVIEAMERLWAAGAGGPELPGKLPKTAGRDGAEPVPADR
jgi:hypothetical protein